jgi:acyl-CoA dehydrogenase
VPLTQRVGEPGEGFKVAMARSTCSAPRWRRRAGLRPPRADEALARATRKMFGKTLADFQLTQAKLAQMATTIDAPRCWSTAPPGCATRAA